MALAFTWPSPPLSLDPEGPGIKGQSVPALSSPLRALCWQSSTVDFTSLISGWPRCSTVYFTSLISGWPRCSTVDFTPLTSGGPRCSFSLPCASPGPGQPADAVRACVAGFGRRWLSVVVR